MAALNTTDRPMKKGERTRHQIKKAVLEVLAISGVSAVTHRSVAAQAGVSLSATTYHFESLEDMLFQAFDLIEFEGDGLLEDTLKRAGQYIEQAGLTPESSQESRKEIRDVLANLAADFLLDASPVRRLYMEAEIRFIQETAHIEPLKERIEAYRERARDSLIRLPESIGSDDPRLDTQILYDAVQSIQIKALAQPEKVTRDYVTARVGRLLGWILGCR